MDGGEMVPIVIFGGGFAVAIVAMIMKTIRTTSERKHIEETKREMAAYVAEGSISPDDAAKILSAGASADAWKAQVAKAVADKNMSAKEGERLIRANRS